MGAKVATGASRPKMMPANVRAGQVISLVEVTGGLGPKIDTHRLADELGADIAIFLPILDAAELLGLVKKEKGEVALTDFGLKLQKATKNKVRLLRDHLSQIEPFKSALELASRNGEVTAEEVAEVAERNDMRWHHDRELNVSLIHTLLVHWAIYAGLLTYNGKKGKFRKC
jgi:hypothetical protein